MEYQFTAEQDELRAAVRSMLTDRATPRENYDGGPALDTTAWTATAELGLCGLGVDEAHGGSGGDLIDQIVVVEEIGRVAAALPFTSSVVVSLPLLDALVSDEQRAALLPDILSGDRVCTTALTGNGTGNAPDAVASSDGTLSGTLSLVPDGAAADLLLVPCDDAVHAVPVDGGGVVVTDEPTLDRTRRVATVVLDQATGERLDTGDVQRELRNARRRALVSLAADATGSADLALDMTAAYAREREQFGTVIGTFQAVKHRVADMLVDLENARSATMFGAWAVAGDAPDADAAAAVAKAAATEKAVEVVGGAIQVHGGIAITWEHDLHLLLRRVKSCEIAYGEPSLHLESVAAELLG